ncbi:hypothetical protein BH24ACT16_BH24ACT16_13150 [soil metagenome]|jgi:hypothetical protein
MASVRPSNGEAKSGFESGMEGVGVWSSRGEFLGLVSDGAGPPGFGAEGLSRSGEAEPWVSATLHRFARGGEEGYRVLVRHSDSETGGETSSYWIAPTVEDEGYIGMFNEDEARRAFPDLFAAQAGQGGSEID